MASEGKYFKGDIHTLGNVGIGNLSASYKLDVTGAANISGNLSIGGIPTAPTASAGTDTTQLATTAFVRTEVANLVDSSPPLLNTLNELAAALNDDANFAGTVTSSLALKAPLASPALTGTPTAPTASAGTNTTQIATTAFVNSAVALENSLAEMDDVMLSSVGDGELIVYNSGAWHNKTLTEAGILPLAGGTMTGDAVFNDNVKAKFGTDSDLELYSNDTNAYIDGRKGDLYLRTVNVGDDIFLQASDDVFLRPNNGSAGITVKGGGAVELYHNASKTFETTASGATLTGDLTVGDGHFIGDDSFDNLTLISSSGENVVIASANDIYLKTDASGGGTGTNRVLINESGTSISSGTLKLLDGTGGSPSLTFSNGLDTGFYRSDYTSSPQKDQVNLSIDGNTKFKANEAGIWSVGGNIYFANGYQVRTFQEWLATTGGSGYGFKFRNTADGIDSAVISNIGELTLKGNTSPSKIEVYETFTDASNYERSFFKHASSFLEIGTEALGTGTASGIKFRTTGVSALSIDAGGLVTVLSRNSASSTNILSVGGSSNGYMSVRHVEGKNSSSNAYGPIYINHLSNNNVFLASGGGKVGIGQTSSPDAWLSVVKDNDNSGDQFLVADTEGASAAVRTYTHGGSPAGLILNHYYAVAGSSNEYMRYADFVANVGNGAGTTMRFITKNAANTYSTTVIDNDGNVGIGTTTPSHKLHVRAESDGDWVARIGNTESTAGSNYGLKVGGGSNASDIGFEVANYAGDVNLRVRGDGNVGIGTTTPEAKLDIKTASSAWNYGSGFSDSAVRITGEADGTNQGGLGLSYTDSGGGIMCPIKHGNDYRRMTISCKEFRVEYGSAQPRFFINSVGKVGIGTTSPTQKLQISDDAPVLFLSSQVNSAAGSKIRFSEYHSGSFQGAFLHYDGDNNRFNIGVHHANDTDLANDANAITIRRDNSFVGLGVAVPTTRLEVSGSAIIDGGVGVSSSGTLHLRQKGDTANDGLAITSSHATSHRIWKDANGKLNIGPSSNTDAFVLDLNSNVGIGTSTPNFLLDVEGSGASMRVRNTATDATTQIVMRSGGSSGQNQIVFGDDDDANRGMIRYRHNGDSLAFDVADAERMRITSVGNVGIGTTSPTATLEVVGKAKFTATSYHSWFNFGTDEDTYIRGGKAGSEVFINDSHNSNVLIATGGGNVGIGTTSPASILDVNGGSANGVKIQAANAATEYVLSATTSNGTSRLWVGGTGNVGIGITGPQSKFHVSGGDIRIDNNQQYLAETVGGGVIGVAKMDGSDNLLIGDGNLKIDVTGTTARLIIDSSGNTTLAGNLTVQGDISTTGTFTIIDTDVSTTEQLLVTNDGTGPAVVVNQKGVQPVVDFQDDGTSVFYIENGGNVGIGITDPTEKLEVIGDIFINGGPAGGRSLALKRTGATNAWKLTQGHTQTDYLEILEGSDTRFLIKNGGNVGIGETSPSKKLHIDGDIKVKNSGKLFLWNDNDNNYLDYQNWIASTGNAQLIRNTGAGGIKLKSTSLEVVVTSGLGIGVTSPESKVHIQNTVAAGSDNFALHLHNPTHAPDSRVGMMFRVNNNTGSDIDGAAIQAINNGVNGEAHLTFGTVLNGTFDEHVRIASDGKVGIGKDPSVPLDVNGNIKASQVGVTNIVTNKIVKFAGTYFDDSSLTDTGSVVTCAANLAVNGELNVDSGTLYVDPSGDKVGIGTTGPSFDLDVHGASAGTGVGIRLRDPAGRHLVLSSPEHSSSPTGSAFVGTDTNHHLTLQAGVTSGGQNYINFKTAGSDQMRLTYEGKLGIGVTDPDQTLDVGGNIRIPNQGKIVFGSAGTTPSDYLQLYDVGTSGDLLKLVQDGNTRFTITGVSGDVYMQGDVGIGNTSPAAKLHVTGTGRISGHTDLQSTVDISNTTRVYTKLSVGNSAWITPSQVLEVGTNTDVSAQIGRAHVGYVGFGDWAGFAHLDAASTTNYALIQNSSGQTLLNKASGQQILFRDANSTIGGFNSSNDFYVDTDTLYVDASESRVGIGTTGPTKPLDVRAEARVWNGANGIELSYSTGNTTGIVASANTSGGLEFRTNIGATAKMFITNAGNVGIGTNAPSQKLDISAGNIELDSAYAIQWGGTANRIWGSGGNNYIKLETNGVERLRVDGQGDVGINETNPAEKLHVKGNARVGYSSTNGHLIGSKAYTITHNFTTGITVSLAHHTACHVKVFITGDWSNHSSLAYVGEFIIQNAGDTGYNEPGIILTQQDNLPTDSIAAKIVDPTTGGGSPNDFTIQFQAVSDTSESISGRLCYHIMGDALSVS